jgi:hypothetical protein
MSPPAHPTTTANPFEPAGRGARLHAARGEREPPAGRVGGLFHLDLQTLQVTPFPTRTGPQHSHASRRVRAKSFC